MYIHVRKVIYVCPEIYVNKSMYIYMDTNIYVNKHMFVKHECIANRVQYIQIGGYIQVFKTHDCKELYLV